MIKSCREASSSRASTALVSIWMLTSRRGFFSRILRMAGTASLIAGAVTAPTKTEPPLPSLQIRDFAVDLAQFEQDGARPPRQRLPVGSKSDAARQALAERHLEDAFHLRNHRARRPAATCRAPARRR